MRLHSSTSLAKHDDFGMWFTCIAAGYALARAAELVRRWHIKIPVVLIAFTATIWVGMRYMNDNWVNTNGQQSRATQTASLRVYAFLKPYLESGPRARYFLAGASADPILYDEHLNVPWYQYYDDTYVKYPVPGMGGDIHGGPGLTCGGPRHPTLGPNCVYLEGISAERAAIRAHWFNLISMIGNYRNSEDAAVLAAVRTVRGYKLISHAGTDPVFIYAPDYPRSLGGTGK